MSVSSADTGSITTANTASAEALNMTITVAWGSLDAVNLSQAADGVTKVWYNNEAVPASNDIALIKAGLATFTLDASTLKIDGRALTNDQADLLNGKVMDVKVTATDAIRIGTTLSQETGATTATNGVDANGKPAAGYYVGVTTSPLTVGTLTFSTNASHVVSLAYTSKVKDLDGTANNYELYYSVTPDNSSGLESKLVGAAYGTLTVSLSEH